MHHTATTTWDKATAIGRASDAPGEQVVFEISGLDAVEYLTVRWRDAQRILRWEERTTFGPNGRITDQRYARLG